MRNCAVCGAEYEWNPEKESEHFSVLCPECSDRPLPILPWGRYIAALERLRGLVEGGLALEFYNCDEIGSKENWCTWGLCNESKEMWPDAEDHLWPYSFTTEGRVAPLWRQKGQDCPLDAKPNRPGAPQGCFYSCQVFSGKSFLLSPNIVIAKIDKLLEVSHCEGGQP